jgi:hypothetical protein
MCKYVTFSLVEKLEDQTPFLCKKQLAITSLPHKEELEK